jgi:3-hydroxyacyl-CoA dehydrogenase/enoyl-CoA hydratase/3-hydroxybutyryl-CoA epimerase
MSDMTEMPSTQEQGGYETLTYRLADSGVAFIAIDVRDRPVNILTPDLHREIGDIADHLAADEAAVGAVLHSGKKTFMAGGDLKRIVQYYDMDRSAEEAYSHSRRFTESLRKLETCGKPVAAAINGSALGGGLELTLACHYRVVVHDENILLGLPEVTLGLLPGAGGTQRMPRLIGLKKASSLIMSGKPVSPEKAQELGFIDHLCPAEDLLAEAEKWVLESGEATQPWDRRGFRIPGGAKLNDMNVGRLFQVLTAETGAKYQHNYPAPIAALRCLFNGTSVNSIDAGLKIETREFSALTRDPVARNIIRTLFINKRKLKFRKEDCNPEMMAHCRQAYIDEGERMLAEGLPPALIENAARAAGMSKGPLEMAGSADTSQERSGADGVDVERLKQRLLCIQALAAIRFQANGDPAEADLNSVLGWGFPSYTGGVMSYIDTMGLGSFVALCDHFAAEFGDRFNVDPELRERARENDRIYPAQA